MSQKYPLTPWGREVKRTLVEKDLTVAQLARDLARHGILTNKCTISSMLRGYRGQRSAELKSAINRFLGIQDVDESLSV